MDFYTHIVEDENGSEMKVFARHDYDIYINQKNYPNEYKVINEILERFIKFYLQTYYEDKIKDTERRVSKLTHESDDLKKNIEDNSDEIKKLKIEIKEREKETIANKKKLEIAKRKLIERKEKLERVRIQLIKL